LYRKLKHILRSTTFFFENRGFYEVMWKNIMRPNRLQMTIWRMRMACWMPKGTNTLRICNNYCLSTATMVARTRLIVTLHVPTLSVLFCFLITMRINIYVKHNLFIYWVRLHVSTFGHHQAVL